MNLVCRWMGTIMAFHQGPTQYFYSYHDAHTQYFLSCMYAGSKVLCCIENSDYTNVCKSIIRSSSEYVPTYIHRCIFFNINDTQNSVISNFVQHVFFMLIVKFF
jgi:hypothetical protein